MDVLTIERMRKIDEQTIARFCPGLELMERAGRKVAEFILARYTEDNFKASIFVGPGNNGGDALVVARYLAEAGRACSVLYLSSPKKFPMDSLKNYQRLQKRLEEYQHLKEISLARSDWVNLTGKDFADSTLIVDGIFGTGLSRPIEGPGLEIVQMINRSDLPVVSIDTPSGINGDTGEVLGDAILANQTITMGYPKLGLLFHPGKSYAGELIIADLGFPEEVREVHSLGIYLLDYLEAARRLPRRPAAAHKYQCGTVLLISGSRMYTGATLLAAEAALRSGWGMVYVAVPEGIRGLVESRLREAITIAVPETSIGTIAHDSWSVISPYVATADALLVGPGMNRRPATSQFVFDLLARQRKPVVLDADGLNALEGESKRLEGLEVPVIVTPHSGELSRLVSKEIPTAPLERIESTRKIAQALGVTLVHKGAPTLVSSAGGEVWINDRGNSALATAGTGDVLAGLIGGFLAQGADPLDAACLGCHLHSRAGEEAAFDLGVRGVIAGDLLEYMGLPILELEANETIL